MKHNRLTTPTGASAAAAMGIYLSGWLRCLGVLLSVLVLLSFSTYEVSQASLLLNNLNVTANLSGVESTSREITQTSIRQELVANWFQNLTPYLSVYASAAYYKNDLDRDFEIGLFKEEFTPSAKLTLNHPLLRLNMNLSKTETVGSMVSEELTRKNFSADLQSKMANLPIFSAQFSRSSSRDNENSNGRNTTDRSLGFSVTDDWGDWYGRYRLSQINSHNLISQFESTAYRHTAQLRWGRELFYNKKPIRLYGDYLLSYRTQTDLLPNNASVMHLISPANGLYAEHQDATYGWLEPNQNLTDNNVSSPTSPSINIGTGSTNQHLGLDLSISQTVGGLYIYTDRLSDEAVSWEIYVSEDGLEWELHDLAPQAFFDATFNRYELVFEELSTRYLKAISSGLNRIENVFVTEIAALAEIATTGVLKQSNSSHRINVGGSIELNKKWKASSDISLQNVPAVGLASGRTNYSQSILASYQATKRLLHSYRLQLNLTSATTGSRGFADYLISYNARYEPLPTLKLIGSASGRIARANGVRDSEGINLSGKVTADPIEDLNFELQAGYSFDNRPAVSRQANSWNTRVSLNARASRSLEFRLGYGFRAVNVKNASEVKPQQEYQVTVILRPFRKLQLNGQVNRTTGRHVYLQRSLTASWNFSRSLSVTGQYRYSKDSENNRAEREMVNMNWRVGAKADIYVGFNKNDLSGTAASSSAANAGIRMRL